MGVKMNKWNLVWSCTWAAKFTPSSKALDGGDDKGIGEVAFGGGYPSSTDGGYEAISFVPVSTPGGCADSFINGTGGGYIWVDVAATLEPAAFAGDGG
jgi:hypothetical protein